LSVFFTFFFFSSRRRHTRFSRDWSSDVCSSDLKGGAPSKASTTPEAKTMTNSIRRRSFALSLTTFLLAPALGCGSAVEADGYAITLEVRLTPVAGQLQFVSPAGSIIETPVAEIVGKPYYTATFEAGFSSGNDLPLYEQWGTVPEGLDVDIFNPPIFDDGAAYDVVFVVYVNTEAGPDAEPPAAVNGDLATF